MAPAPPPPAGSAAAKGTKGGEGGKKQAWVEQAKEGKQQQQQQGGDGGGMSGGVEAVSKANVDVRVRKLAVRVCFWFVCVDGKADVCVICMLFVATNKAYQSRGGAASTDTHVTTAAANLSNQIAGVAPAAGGRGLPPLSGRDGAAAAAAAAGAWSVGLSVCVVWGDWDQEEMGLSYVWTSGDRPLTHVHTY